MASFKQDIFPESPREICLRDFSQRQAGNAVRILLQSSVPDTEIQVIGIAVKVSSKGIAEQIALATFRLVVTITLEPNGIPVSDSLFKDLLTGDVLRYGQDTQLVGFLMARAALQMHHVLNKHVRATDLSSLSSPSNGQLHPPSKVFSRLFHGAQMEQMIRLWNGTDDAKTLAMRAWMSAKIGESYLPLLRNATKIDTRYLSDGLLRCLSLLVIESDCLDHHKPKEMPNEFERVTIRHDGRIDLVNSRYKSRIRQSKQTHVVMADKHGREIVGRAGHVSGKTTTIKVSSEGLLHSGDLAKVRVVGKEEATNAEKAREALIYLTLTQPERKLEQSLFIRRLWFPGNEKMYPKLDLNRLVIQQHEGFDKLNPSQKHVVSAMVSELQLVIVHGPPGTGKTTTIAMAAQIWGVNRRPTWIVAQSNVAVKNIAEKLFAKKVDFKILVSKEFYVEWHEHIYSKIERNLLRLDDLSKDKTGMEKLLGGSCVILSTLSTLFNPAISDNGTFEHVPVTRLVVDEASQIRVFEFMPIFEKFQDLEKICFFGDPKQLPPYGKNAVPSIQTIYDIKHLARSAYFLDTQYRMPTPIGSFISQEVYGGNLHSEHEINSPNCLAFVDVGIHAEEAKCGFSWTNDDEIRSIIHLVRFYYQKKNFSIVTPYDGQRAAIEKALKAEALPWERVYNVDSFQGNEDSYILISVVRTDKPGFLNLLNRMNVMLTRCRTGMVVVASRHFLSNNGADTLLGKLARYWTKTYSDYGLWVDWKLVAERKVDLPGISIPKLLNSNNRSFPYQATTSSQYGPVHSQPVVSIQSTSGFHFSSGWNSFTEFPPLSLVVVPCKSLHGRWKQPISIPDVENVHLGYNDGYGGLPLIVNKMSSTSVQVPVTPAIRKRQWSCPPKRPQESYPLSTDVDPKPKSIVVAVAKQKKRHVIFSVPLAGFHRNKNE